MMVMKDSHFRHLVGKRIKHYRELLRLSQQDLADLAALNRSYIGGVERGERNLGIDNLHKIATGLGIETWKLLKEDETD
ncbi:MAG: hypothetical protein QOE96_3787 [Blastocatellia bacterium]|jgi:transcriptional regulator with XRE-family HTH domain|nr:hypothetical protein [Blastocatellia bacterium]